MKASGLATGKYLISKIEYKTFTNKPGNFLSCELTDRSGSIKAVMWEGADHCKSWLTSKMVVDIVGEINYYKDIPQVQLKSISLANTYDTKDFLPTIEPVGKITAYFEELALTEIKDIICKKIWDAFLSTYKDKFCLCPGGVGDVHHAYIGGLIDHTCIMVRLAEEVAKNHYGLDKDLLKTGCLVHDIAKMRCYHWDTAIEMSDDGRLLHHTVIGYQMFMDITDMLKIPRSNPTLIKLGHIIANHHEDEGIKNTAFPEANAVGLIDNLNAQINFSMGYCSKEENRDPGSNWTKYCHLTGRQYFIPKIEPIKIDLTPILDGIS